MTQHAWLGPSCRPQQALAAVQLPPPPPHICQGVLVHYPTACHRILLLPRRPRRRRTAAAARCCCCGGGAARRRCCRRLGLVHDFVSSLVWDGRRVCPLHWLTTIVHACGAVNTEETEQACWRWRGVGVTRLCAVQLQPAAAAGTLSASTRLACLCFCHSTSAAASCSSILQGERARGAHQVGRQQACAGRHA